MTVVCAHPCACVCLHCMSRCARVYVCVCTLVSQGEHSKGPEAEELLSLRQTLSQTLRARLRMLRLVEAREGTEWQWNHAQLTIWVPGDP